MEHGSRPTLVYHRNYSYEQTFGATQTVPMPSEYDCDNGTTMPDQNADGNPFECTDYTIRDIRTDNDSIFYVPGYLYAHMLFMENKPATQQGGIPMDAFKASRVYGLLATSDAPLELVTVGENINADIENWPASLNDLAGKHRNGQYFDVDKVSNSYFIGIQNALWRERLDKRSMAVGTPWFPEWENTPSSGIMPDFHYSGNPNDYPWHEYKCSGFVRKNTKGEWIRNGEQFLKLKTWQGKGFGDNGFSYLDMSTTEKLFAIYGTSLFIPAVATAADVQRVKLDALDTLLSYYYRLLEIMFKP